MQFKGTVTSVSPVQSGTSKAGKQWSKVDVVLTYDNSKPEYPKSIVFSVMNDNINKFAFRAGAEYEVDVDFSTREYNGRVYMSASCWRAAEQSAQQPQQAPAQQGWEQMYQQPQAQPQTPKDDMGDPLPF